MAAQTKKEKICKLFKMVGLEKMIKEAQGLFMEDVMRRRSSSFNQEMIRVMIEEFIEETIKILKSGFEKIVDERFTKVGIEKLIAMYSDPLYKRLQEAENEIVKAVEPKMDELAAEMQTKLMFLSSSSSQGDA
ncbi:hypothetical protein MYX07_02050 [Patescibacteria group bacterium AH-259-L07]|nr:hypothetical protein [Patescibacteria group bacterium AH-259-L07]